MSRAFFSRNLIRINSFSFCFLLNCCRVTITIKNTKEFLLVSWINNCVCSISFSFFLFYFKICFLILLFCLLFYFHFLFFSLKLFKMFRKKRKTIFCINLKKKKIHLSKIFVKKGLKLFAERYYHWVFILKSN